MKTLVFLCSVILTQGVQGWTTEQMYETTTEASPSCRYNCGYNMGSCSCSSSCQWNGNCCHDYYSYCGYDSTTTTEYPTTSQPSCRHNCGYNMGSCSCSSSCQWNGNCCHDYYSYCGYDSTTTTEYPTTAQPSCRYNCGYNMGSCSCSSSCQWNGNCCHDFYNYCDWTTVYPTPTSAQPSCRYNCGYHMGSCSCSSSCQFYGNCCNDYYSYCGYSTTYPTTSQPSCRYNCGYNMGSCSCSSSCQWNGNCCHDYYSYCSVETTTSGPCGGSLFGTGTFSSPNHPNYYNDNAYCVWQLRAANDQRIVLSFSYLQLENCCSCDYISIYNGPYVSSPYLGKVCNNSLSTFYSTSNYMTVVFRTDSSVVGRGFRAEFGSSLKPSSGRVECSSDKMNIIISRSYLSSLGYDGNSLSVDDSSCRPQINSYDVVFSFNLNTCGTIRQFDKGRILYTNNIRGRPSTQGDITRQSYLKMNVTCLMDQDSISQIMYVVKNEGNSSIIGSGRYNSSMTFYTYSNFYYPVTEYPYKVELNQNLYVQVDVSRPDSNIILFLDTCVASKSPNDFVSRPYYLVRNGCKVDSTYSQYSSGSSYRARFSFRAFQFLQGTDSVYLQCKVLICPTSDSNSRCRRGCTRRVTRELESKHESQTLVVGPIQLKDSEKEEPEKQNEA